MPEVSIVIPAYNEESRLLKTLESVHQCLSAREADFEIVVVDDGSTDTTVNLVDQFAMHHDGVRLISYSPNQGKGHAVRTGIRAAKGDLILIDDADGSAPIAELSRLEDAISAGADIAIGSRNMPDQNRVINALAYRKYIGNTFNIIVQSLLLPGVRDTQCGFKLFKWQVAQDIFSVAAQNGFAFDVEILYIAKIRGYKISEIAIDWSNVEGSKVNLVIDSLKMLLEVLKIRITALIGGYKKLERNGRPVHLEQPVLPLKELPRPAQEPNQPDV
ncbi:MAG TPA: dolichyl-phosphate beta-glucosyltransferase [Chroococcales cyanobacterium]